MKVGSWWLVLVVVAFMSGNTHADVVIGQTAGFTGAAAPSVAAMTQGAKLIIDRFNAEGGVQGEKIKLVSLDDENNPRRAGENAKRLIEQEKAVALFLTRGTPHTIEMLPLLAKHGIPLIGPSTGAMVLHKPVVREVFNVRPTYQYEAERAVAQLASMTLGDRVGVVYSGDAFGQDALIGIHQGFEKIGAKPIFTVPYDAKSEDISSALRQATQLVNGTHPAVIVIGTSRVTTSFVRKLRAAGGRGYVLTLSTNASDGFIDGLGTDANYVIVSQAFPSERALHIPVVKEVSDLLRASGTSQALSPAMLEGAVAAKVLVEALRRCAPSCTSAKLVSVLESGKPIDVGLLGQDIRYTKLDHSGLRYSDTSIIVAGKFRR